MNTTRLHSSVLPLQGGVNFRDQGGYPAADGRRVKPGLLLRSGALDELTEQDCRYLSELSVKHIIDYRDADEEQAKPDVIWSGANYQNVPANPLAAEVTANLDLLSGDTLANFDPAAFMFELYRRLPFNNSAYRYLTTVIQQPESGGLVQHCAVGKDRTGVGSAIVLFSLGASYDTVMEDYLLTDITLAPYRSRMIEHAVEKVGERAVEGLSYVLSARQEFLDTALAEIKTRYATIDSWLESEFGLNAEKRKLLQQKYLTE